MEFSRIGEHTIKCVISEEEIYDLGYTMDEIMSNGERTQEFMNQIFDMASEEFGTDFNSGIKTVRADFLADHTLSLTFSEHPATEGMMEHLKDIVNGLLNSLPAEAAENEKNKKGRTTAKKQALIAGWVKSGKLAPIDPQHLIFMIWASTQHYADFAPQVEAVTGATLRDEVFFNQTVENVQRIIIEGIRPR